MGLTTPRFYMLTGQFASMDILGTMQARYSCRSFSDKPVEQEKIDRIIEAARCAPSAVNRQPVHVWVVKSPSRIEDMKACTRYTFNSTCILMFGYSDDAWVRPFDNKRFGDVDATIAATQAMLEVTAQGLESTWVGYFDPAVVKERFPETKGYTITALFPIGYPAEDGTPSARHSERKGKEEFSTIL